VIWPEHAVLPFTSIATNSASYIRSEFPGVDVHLHTRALQQISKGIIVTTDGADSIYTLDETGTAFSVQPPKVSVVDATGAGDAFRAGLLYGLTNKFELQRCVCMGAAAGSLKVGHLGAATTLPALSEIVALANTLSVTPA
jgi:sugar/nucleoside kinase (ribokinase family)